MECVCDVWSGDGMVVYPQPNPCSDGRDGSLDDREQPPETRE